MNDSQQPKNPPPDPTDRLSIQNLWQIPQSQQLPRRPHPEDGDWIDRSANIPAPPLPPQRPPYGFQFITGSWREFLDGERERELRRRSWTEAVESFRVRLREALDRRSESQRRVSLVERRVSARAKVQALGDRHIPDLDLGLPGHSVPVVGCPWCIDGERAQRADDMLGALNPEEWHELSAHTARFILAIGDLARERSQ